MFFQVQLNIFCSIRLFAGFQNFIDMNSRTAHTEALFGYRYSVARPHFIRNQAISVDCTLSNCYQSFSVSFKPCLSQNGFILYPKKVQFAFNKHHKAYNCIVLPLMIAKLTYSVYFNHSICYITSFPLDVIHLYRQSQHPAMT